VIGPRRPPFVGQVTWAAPNGEIWVVGTRGITTDELGVQRVALYQTSGAPTRDSNDRLRRRDGSSGTTAQEEPVSSV
jgi:hypothetical protein